MNKNKLAISAFVAGLLILTSAGQARENPYLEIYEKSLHRMSTPDVLGDATEDMTASELNRGILLAAGTSKTCSQRCSTRCSVSCTTTRGCSSQCKVQTDGCGGYNPPLTPPEAPKPPSTIPSETSPPAGTSPARSVPKSFSGETTSVLEGDILSVRQDESSQVRTRLARIDAPEIGQPFADEAKAALAGKVLGKKVLVLPTSVDDQGMVVALVYLDTRCINRELIEEGMAWCCKDGSPSEALAKAEEKARASKIGLWTDANPVPPWEYRRALAAKMARRQGQPIQTGDTVKVIEGPAPLQIGTQVLALVDTGTTLLVGKGEGEWASVTIEKDGKKITGWIHTKRLVRIAGEAGKPPSDGTAPVNKGSEQPSRDP